MPVEIDRPDVVAEVRAMLERYNAAIDNRDVATLKELFWDSDKTVRFGFGENLFGHDEISRYRDTARQSSAPRRIAKMVIVTVGNDSAATSVVLERGDAVSRQSQTWARMPEGWRIIAAHVSVMKT
jgi:hypothetical protein